MLAIAFKLSVGLLGFVILVTGARFLERLADFMLGFIEGQMEGL